MRCYIRHSLEVSDHRPIKRKVRRRAFGKTAAPPVVSDEHPQAHAAVSCVSRRSSTFHSSSRCVIGIGGIYTNAGPLPMA